jgi:hypothetical protein
VVNSHGEMHKFATLVDFDIRSQGSQFINERLNRIIPFHADSFTEQTTSRNDLAANWKAIPR